MMKSLFDGSFAIFRNLCWPEHRNETTNLITILVIWKFRSSDSCVWNVHIYICLYTPVSTPYDVTPDFTKANLHQTQKTLHTRTPAKESESAKKTRNMLKRLTIWSIISFDTRDHSYHGLTWTTWREIRRVGAKVFECRCPGFFWGASQLITLE